MSYVLRLIEDRFEPGSRRARPLAALNRVLYVRSGEIVATVEGRDTSIPAGRGWHAAGGCGVAAGAAGADVLRYELVREPGAPPTVEGAQPGVTSRLVLEHPIALDPVQKYLMRNDRVDFAPGGEALAHRHRGGGIRCLLEGRLELRIEGHEPRAVTPGGAWFESGREPVHAAAAPEAATSFIRVSILPREIRGQSSIMYVDSADAARSKPRQYTVHVDEPIELP